MYVELLYDRLVKLRTQKGVSARDMSLSIGQSESYINKIENKKSLPSMMGFFYICEYLNVHPKDFFDDTINCPESLNKLISELKRLDETQIAQIIALVKNFK